MKARFGKAELWMHGKLGSLQFYVMFKNRSLGGPSNEGLANTLQNALLPQSWTNQPVSFLLVVLKVTILGSDVNLVWDMQASQYRHG